MKEQNVIGTHAAARRLPAGAPAAQAGGPLVHRRLRRVVPRPGGLHRGHRAARGAARRLRRGHPRHRGVRARLPPPPARRRRHRAALRAVHRLDRRHHADPLLRRSRSCRPCSAATRGCSSCTSTTRWRCCTGRSSRTTPARSTSPAPGVLVAVPGDPPGRPGRRAGARAGPVRRSPRSPGPAASADFGLDQLDLFVHGRVVDTTRLIEEFGFTPRSTAEAFDDFIRGHHGGSWSPGPARRGRAAGPGRHPAGPLGRPGAVVTGPEDGATAVDRRRRPQQRRAVADRRGAGRDRPRAPASTPAGPTHRRSRPARPRSGRRRHRRWRTGRDHLGPRVARPGVPAPPAHRRLRGRRVRLRPGADRRGLPPAAAAALPATGSAPRSSASSTCPADGPGAGRRQPLRHRARSTR